jgi:DNA uptake protein ComE-like DNA-binding protein
MKTIRKWIRNLLGFSGREVNGFLILLPLMFIMILVIPAYQVWLSNRTDDFTEEEQTLDSLMAFWDVPSEQSEKEVVPQLFNFDPNKASEEMLRKLGFSEILSKRIANYRQKGGQFRTKRDLLKIYGVDSTFYSKLHNHILLPDTIEKRTTGTNFIRKETKAVFLHFDLNTAATLQLESVYGIGPALASRIIRFRDGLGGFIKQEQLYEVYALDSAVVRKLMDVTFIDKQFVPRKIDLNTASEKDLSSHPYIKRSMANAIVSYRFQHGAFKTVADLRDLAFLKPADIDKITPYLMVKE